MSWKIEFEKRSLRSGVSSGRDGRQVGFVRSPRATVSAKRPDALFDERFVEPRRASSSLVKEEALLAQSFKFLEP